MLGSAITLVAIPVQMYTRPGARSRSASSARRSSCRSRWRCSGRWPTFDHRRLMIGAELGSLTVTLALCANAALADPYVWPLYVASALLAGFMAILRPPLDALVPRLVERRELPAASAALRRCATPPRWRPGAGRRADRGPGLLVHHAPASACFLLARGSDPAAIASRTPSRRASGGSSRAASRALQARADRHLPDRHQRDVLLAFAAGGALPCLRAAPRRRRRGGLPVRRAGRGRSRCRWPAAGPATSSATGGRRARRRRLGRGDRRLRLAGRSGSSCSPPRRRGRSDAVSAIFRHDLDRDCRPTGCAAAWRDGDDLLHRGPQPWGTSGAPPRR